MINKKMLLLLLSLLFVTGCGNISYDIDIRRNKIYENLEIEIFDFHRDLDLNSIVNDNIKVYPSSEIKNVNYEVNNNKINIFNNFNSIKNLSTNKIIGMFYNQVDVKINDNITKVVLSEYNNTWFECGEFDEDCSQVLDKVNVTLTSEYEIIDSNADLIDKRKNKYTWILDYQSNDLYFSYSDMILWNIVIKNFINENYDKIILWSVCLAILLTIIIMLVKFLKTMKENNS